MSAASSWRTRRLALLACLAAASGWATASGLQVTPTLLSLKSSQNAESMELDNTSDGVVHAQVRVYHWTQNENGDQLEPSRNLVISPPMLQVGPGAQQMIRVIRVGMPPLGADATEDAYRLAVDELPIDAGGKPGLHFVVHYSVPVFVQPTGVQEAAPQLQWALERQGQQAVLQVSNRGNGHAQLATMDFVDAGGRRTEVDPGLLGYVLPGSTMHWVLKPPAAVFASGGSLEVMVNGQKTSQNLSFASRSP